MKEAIETRELIVLDGLDVIARGTYHKTCADYSQVQPKLVKRGHTGVLFLNSPSSTRAAQGDSAVYWADSFAEQGYPSFRLDLPGFGDSEGDPPTEMLDLIGQGGYAPITTSKIRELVARFNLDGVVIVEQCSTSISTLYAAACCPECKGIVLMDPCFDLPQVTEPTILRHPDDRTSQGCLRSSRSICNSLTWGQLFHETAASENATVLHRRLPILIFKTLNRKSMLGEVDYLNNIVGLAGRKGQIVVNMLDGPDRSFTSRVSRLIIRQRAAQWLNSCFPLTNCTEDPQMPHIRNGRK